MTASSKTTKTVNYKRSRNTKRGKPRFYKDSWIGRFMEWLWRQAGRLRRILFSKWMLGVIGSLIFTFMIFGCIALIYYATMLPDISGLAKQKDQAGVEMLAEDGSVLARYGQITGKYIPYRELPQPLVQAVLATEDRRFFSHFGVDIQGIARAMVVNAMSGRVVQGGSTITQQLAKNIFLNSERTLSRKVQELMMAFWLEQNFTKEEILAIYLNRVYLGGGSYGVDSASHFYFDKSATELDVVESAMLAGLLKAPSRYNPTSNTELAVGRTKQVLLNMQDAEYLTEEEAEKAIASLSDGSRKFKQKLFDNQRYFTDWIMEQLPEYIGDMSEDVIVTTTIDANWQRAAEDAMQEFITPEVMKEKRFSQAAFLAMRPNGAVVSMVGGVDYNKSQYNRATQARRQPGSAFKMFVYLAGMEQGYTPDTPFLDSPITVGKWTPKNYNNEYMGHMTLRQALTRSSNVIAVKLSQMVGIKAVRNVAKRLGVSGKIPTHPSIALGSVEMTLEQMVRSYAHLANNGKAVKPYGIIEVRRKEDGKLLYARTDRDDFSNVTVISENNVAKMNDMLSSVISSGTARAAQIGRSAAGKTGTTSDYKDAWFVGYTPHLVAGVWVGNDNATAMSKVTGGSIPARVWQRYMKTALQEVPADPLPTYYNAAYELLPWQTEGAADGQGGYYGTPQPYGQEGGYAPQQQQMQQRQPGQQQQRQGEGYNLDKSFWDTLFDVDKSKVEYSYPNER